MRLKRLLLFLALVLVPGGLWAQENMTNARAEIRQLLSEQTAKFWTDAQVDTAWDRAQIQVGTLAGVLIQKFATIRTPNDSLNVAAFGATKGRWFYKFGAAPVRLRSVMVDSGLRSPLFLTIVDNPGQIPYLSTQTKPTYCYLHDTVLVFYPPVDVSVIERMQISYFARPAWLTSATTQTDLPIFIQPAAVWLAASFLMNQDYKYDVSQRYYQRALDLITAYRSTFQMQTEVIRGTTPVTPAGK